VPTIFTRIINGEIPGRFVVQDDICVAFLDVRPLTRGHALVVPRDEVDHWVDLSPEVASHLMVVAQRVGSAQRKLLSPARIGMMIAGFEVPHVHVHVVPMDSMAAMDFSNANPNPDQGDLDQLRSDLAGLLE
jgi:histidine triad (HIT) family protein